MNKLPKQVLSVKKKILSQTPPNPLSDVVRKLIIDKSDFIDPKDHVNVILDCLSMWETIEKHKQGTHVDWVWGFLKAAFTASNLPAYHHMKAVDRRKISKLIKKFTGELSDALINYDLDAHIIVNNGIIFNGFFVFDDLDEHNQEFASGKQKILFTAVLKEISNRSTELLEKESIRGKNSKNARAIRFIRHMHKRNLIVYGTPLNQVIATASNLIFKTNYFENDISNLISR